MWEKKFIVSIVLLLRNRLWWYMTNKKGHDSINNNAERNIY